MDVEDLRKGIVTALSGISGLHVYWYQADRPVPPFVTVRPSRIEYRVVLGDTTLSDVTLSLTVCVAAADGGESVSQSDLDEYLSTSGARSIPAAIAADTDLGVTGANAAVVAVEDYGDISLADGTRWIGATLTVEVMA